MPLQGVPPSKGLHATSNHQSPPKHVRSGFDALLFGHPLLDALPVQVSPVHPNSAARPLVGLHPAIVSRDVTFEVGYTLVLLDVVTPNDGALEVGFLINQHDTTFALEVTGCVATLVRVWTLLNARSRNALLRFRRGRSGGREFLAARRLGLRRGPALLLPPGGSGLNRAILLIIVGGRDVVDIALTIRFRGIVARGRSGWSGRGRGNNVCVVRSRCNLRRVTAVVEVGCIGCHGRRVDRCRRQVGNGEDVACGRWGEFVVCHRRRKYARNVVGLEQLGVDSLISVVKATR